MNESLFDVLARFFKTAQVQEFTMEKEFFGLTLVNPQTHGCFETIDGAYNRQQEMLLTPTPGTEVLIQAMPVRHRGRVQITLTTLANPAFLTLVAIAPTVGSGGVTVTMRCESTEETFTVPDVPSEEDAEGDTEPVDEDEELIEDTEGITNGDTGN